MKPIAFILLGLCSVLSCYGAPELRWGEFGYFSKWKRYPYGIESRYEFVGTLPELPKFPIILERAEDPALTNQDREIAVSQLLALSRCDFDEFPTHDADEKTQRQRAVVKWRQWWTDCGKGQAENLPNNGIRDEQAWKLIAPSPYLEGPGYPISIPKVWRTTITFKSGDYGGVTEEVIEIQTKNDECSLDRKYRTGGPTPPEWTKETWKGFARKDADRFYAALIYSIDNPWFFIGDKLVETTPKGQNANSIDRVVGRPKAWSNYHPNVEWSGILNADGKVVMNHDPSSWQTIDHEAAEKTELDQCIGVVFRVVRDLFPDPSLDPDTSKWTRRKD